MPRTPITGSQATRAEERERRRERLTKERQDYFKAQNFGRREKILIKGHPRGVIPFDAKWDDKKSHTPEQRLAHWRDEVHTAGHLLGERERQMLYLRGNLHVLNEEMVNGVLTDEEARRKMRNPRPADTLYPERHLNFLKSSEHAFERCQKKMDKCKMEYNNALAEQTPMVITNELLTQNDTPRLQKSKKTDLYTQTREFQQRLVPFYGPQPKKKKKDRDLPHPK
jgi:hypothetical protein